MGNQTNIRKETISVIIPCRNASKTLYASLEATIKCHPDEVIVVDDNSNDEISNITTEFSCKLIKMDTQGGPAKARNIGASHSRGTILVFVDADVILSPSALDDICKIMESDSTIAAVVTGTATLPGRMGLWGKYKNFYMHYVFSHLPRRIADFYTSACAIRRTIFEKINGFDDEKYKKPGLEDTEFGERLVSYGYQIYLAKEIEIKHLHDYSFSGLINCSFTRSYQFVDIALSYLFKITQQHVPQHNRHSAKKIPLPFDILLLAALINTMLFFLFLACFIEVKLILPIILFLLAIVISRRFTITAGNALGAGWFFIAPLILFMELSIYGIGLISGCFMVTAKKIFGLFRLTISLHIGRS